MEENYIEKLISNEISQMKDSMDSLAALSYLIDSETVKENYAFSYEALNRFKKINIEMTEALILWSNSKK
jgi:hypothetical protein